MAELHVFHCCREAPTSLPSAILPGPYKRVAPAGMVPRGIAIGAMVEGQTYHSSRCREHAIHEAGHAAVTIALGNSVSRVTIDGQPHMRGATSRSRAGRVILILAGDAAQAWATSTIAQMPDADLAAWVVGIRNLRGSSCDRCQAVRTAIVMTGQAPDDVVTAEFKRLEALAGFAVRHPQVWPAIVEIADALMGRGTVLGRTAEKICRRHFEPGFLAFLGAS